MDDMIDQESLGIEVPDGGIQREAMEHFLALKTQYGNQRQEYEQKWRDALASYNLIKEVDKLYEGNSKIKNPVFFIKVNAIDARMEYVQFNTIPFGRIEAQRTADVDDMIQQIHNDHIFSYQLDKIDFRESYAQFRKMKLIQGTAVAKVITRYETEEFSFFDLEEGEEPEEIVVKDDTYYEGLLIEEFYSDINKQNVQESQANIHHTTATWDDLYANQKRLIEEETVGMKIDPITGTAVEVVETSVTEEGVYFNLEQVKAHMSGGKITQEQAQYMRDLGLNEAEISDISKTKKDRRKQGVVLIDECYGKFDINGDGKYVECICTIAEGMYVIRLEPTPYRHKKYKRPFIVGWDIKQSNCLYGLSKLMIGLDLFKEMNASRQQALDSKTFTITPMYYENISADLMWDKKIRPGNIIKGNSPNGLTPIVSPNLQSVGYEAEAIIKNDINQLFGLSEFQNGMQSQTAIPGTARATLAVIAQNDMPLNKLIQQSVDDEIIPFLEMLYERNLVFKDINDLLITSDAQELVKAGLAEQDPQTGELVPKIQMKDLVFDANFKVLGSLELNNETAHQQGYERLLNLSQQIPGLAARIDYEAITQKFLAAYGIKDDSQGVLLDEELVQQAMQQQNQQRAEAEAKAKQEQLQMMVAREQIKTDENIREDVTIENVKSQNRMKEMVAEATVETTTNTKVR